MDNNGLSIYDTQLSRCKIFTLKTYQLIMNQSKLKQEAVVSNFNIKKTYFIK